jgi:arginine decarboxylase
MARLYAKVQKLNVNIQYLNVGGGLGVDYDGSKTSSDASVNYTTQEFTNDIIYTIGSICEAEQVPHPTVITESGRALTAYHSMLITNIIGEVHVSYNKLKISKQDPEVIRELDHIYNHINIKNFMEYYHDALQQKEELLSLFDLGYISLENRAKGEMLFYQICNKALRLANRQKFVAEEFEQLEKSLARKYICNFSLFRSLPDHWSIDQLFPIIPIHRLDELPEIYTTLVDLTCDSDGEMDNFVDLRDIKRVLEVHELSADPYYLGFLMTGAYQDTLGNYHNMFGKLTEVFIIVDNKNNVHVEKIIKGETISEIIEYFGYDRKKIMARLKSVLESKNLDDKKLGPTEIKRLLNEFNSQFDIYSYLAK